MSIMFNESRTDQLQLENRRPTRPKALPLRDIRDLQEWSTANQKELSYINIEDILNSSKKENWECLLYRNSRKDLCLCG